MVVNNIISASLVRPVTEYKTLILNERCIHHHSPVKVERTYFNYLPFNITVVERSGFRHIVPSVTSEHSTHCDFIVQVTYTIKTNNLAELRSIIEQMDIRQCDQLHIIKCALLNDSKYGTRCYNGYEIVLETRYRRELFREINADLYCYKNDLIISSRDVYHASAHPHSAIGVDDEDLLTCNQSELNAGDYASRIELVDNLDEYGPRYVYSLGDVHLIKPKKDLSRTSGVYFTTKTLDKQSNKGYVLCKDKYSFEDADVKFKLYKTKAEAQISGDLALARKLELEEKSHTLALLKKDQEEQGIINKRKLEEIEHERKIESMQWEERLKILQRENEHLEHLREIERNARKDLSERSTLQQKDHTEFLKFLSQAIIGIGTIILAYKKMG